MRKTNNLDLHRLPASDRRTVRLIVRLLQAVRNVPAGHLEVRAALNDYCYITHKSCDAIAAETGITKQGIWDFRDGRRSNPHALFMNILIRYFRARGYDILGRSAAIYRGARPNKRKPPIIVSLDTSQALRAWLKNFRLIRHLSQHQLAARLGVTQTTVSHFLLGATHGGARLMTALAELKAKEAA